LFKIPIHLGCHYKTFGETKKKKKIEASLEITQQKNFGKEDVILSSILSLFQVEIISAVKKKGKKKGENEIRKFCPTIMSNGKLWHLLHIKIFYSYHLIFFLISKF